MLNRDYGPTSKLLHRAALGLPAVLQASFELESLLHSATPASDGKHVFIAGLARSGTTSLLRLLYATNLYQSLTYRHMPFVLMPKTWQKIAHRFQITLPESERAHGDGIWVNFDSPEAFDEVFWRAFCGPDYILDNRLIPQVPDPAVITQFRRYVGHVLAAGEDPARQRYLSKNNNNVLRLTMLREAFPEAVIIVPFRDPIQQSASLWNQHRRFVQRHSKDPFARDYMAWLGHHEFGLTHKPFSFATDQSDIPVTRDTADINYWLDLWVRTYEYVLNQKAARLMLVCYESLCDRESQSLARLLSAAAIPLTALPANIDFLAPPSRTVSGLETALHARAAAIYAEMIDLALDSHDDTMDCNVDTALPVN